MQNLNQYFNKTKIESSPREADFNILLNKIEAGIKNNFYINTNSYAEKVKSPFFAWSFGFSGFAVAALMFFINTQAQNTNIAQVSVATPTEIKDLRQKSTETLKVIDSMKSFDNISNITE